LEQSNHRLQLANWTKNINPSAMQTFLSFADSPDFISLGLGLPDCSLLPKTIVEKSIREIIVSDQNSFQYTQPLSSLKQQIVGLMRERGLFCKENEIFLTTGAQQGISLLVRMLLNHKSSIITENFIYPGFLQAIEPYAPILHTVSTHFRNGINIDDVERILQSDCNPTLIYLVADGGNPHSVTIPLSHREQLASLARKYGVPIIEDDPYGFLNYDNNMLPPIISFDSEWIFYVGTFSKLLAPSFRVGWLIVPENLQKHLSILKEGSDINIASFSQRIVSKILENIKLTDHVQSLINFYRAKREAIHAALNEYFPKDAVYYLPSNGIFFWVKLPDWINMHEFFECALKDYQVAFIPGEAFSIIKNSANKNYIRLNFSLPTLEQIKEGICRLSKVIAYLKEKI
jgi:2-aminoadipate transaminase